MMNGKSFDHFTLCSQGSEPVFSLNFSSAGKGRFVASKAQDMYQRHTLMGGWGGSRVRDMARPLLRNFGAKFSGRSFPLF